MILPSLTQAETYLKEATKLNPGPWEAHSRFTAMGARLIAERHPNLNPQRAYILGLLHDIGRRFGVTQMRHVLDGYIFMEQEGYPEVGRVCLTHSYPDKNLPAQASWDGTEGEFQVFQEKLKVIEYNEYDRLIQLMDCLALPTGFCLMEKRFVDVTLRYGFNEVTTQRWKAYLTIKKQFDEAVGVSVYNLLPGVMENTFEHDFGE